MFLVRSIGQALPGRRDELVKVLQEMTKEAIGFGNNVRVLTASIGPSDATVVTEAEHESLADFEAGLQKANSSAIMSKYMPRLAELSIPGSHRFEIYRICP